MVKYNFIRDYTKDLKMELKGVDEALVVDAMDDAREHLEEMVEDMLAEGDAKKREQAIQKATKQYGSPKMIAKEYIKSDELYKRKQERKKAKRKEEGVFRSMFSVYLDPHTYLGLIYFAILFFLGIFYFAYFITMIVLGISLVPILIGIPILAAFMLSVYPIAWLHGRITEAFLGFKMPKKPRKLRLTGSPWDRIKAIFSDPRLYSSLLYLFLMFPLGMAYFVILVSLLSVSVILFIAPIAAAFGAVMGYPVGLPGKPWFIILQFTVGWVSSFLLLTWTLHLSNIMGAFQGWLSRWLLLKR